MMALGDTSAIVEVTRDKSGQRLAGLLARFPGGVAVTPLTQMEVLLGARDDRHWRRLASDLSAHPLLEISAADHLAAARIGVDLRRRGLTVRTTLDFCIAQAALSNNLPLLHRDRDFEKIRRVRPALSLVWME